MTNSSENRDFVIMQFCMDKRRIVKRTKECLNICSNPKCKSCEPWREAMGNLADEFEELIEDMPEYLTKLEKSILKKSKIIKKKVV